MIRNTMDHQGLAGIVAIEDKRKVAPADVTKRAGVKLEKRLRLQKIRCYRD